MSFRIRVGVDGYLRSIDQDINKEERCDHFLTPSCGDDDIKEVFPPNSLPTTAYYNPTLFDLLQFFFYPCPIFW